jgi:SAM-dependent methyltransferase
MFLWTGLSDVHSFLEILEQSSLPLKPISLLDFGCGCGRLLRFLRGVPENVLRLHGADVNGEHVAWCREHLAPIAFTRNELTPPLPFADATFDALWSLSVFTHLPERVGDAWRAELARVLVPGGIAILTVQGSTSLSKAEADPALAARIGWDTALVLRARGELAVHGHAYARYDATSLAAAKAGDDYGLHFTTEEHVRARWLGAHFELVEYRPGGLRGWQDILVLRRRA